MFILCSSGFAGALCGVALEIFGINMLDLKIIKKSSNMTAESKEQ